MEDKQKLNILIFSWRGIKHPNAGGAEESTHQHAMGWVKAGHSVTLFTSYFAQAKKEEVIDGVKIIREGSQILGVHLAAFKWYFFKNHERFDLVIDQFHGIPFFTPIFVKTKKLAFIHEVTKEVWQFNPWSWPFNLIPAFLGTLFEPLIFKLFYQKIPFMTVSESTKYDLIKWGIPEEHIFVIHNGLSVPKIIKTFSKEKEKTLIYLGALSKDKGIEKALQAFSILNKTNDFRFWVVGKGDGRYLVELRSQARRLKIDKKVKFWGFVSNEKKYELLSKAHLLVFPSVREGWGLVVMEAAYVGTPTIAFDVPGLRDSIKDGQTGVLTKNDPASLALVITKLLGDGKEYNKMCNQADSWSRKFSWEDAVSKSLNLIKNIIG